MARIDGEIVIDRPVDVVFDYVADQSNEPQYNPQMVRAEKITAGRVGAGTRFRSAVASRSRTADMLISKWLNSANMTRRDTDTTRHGAHDTAPRHGVSAEPLCSSSFWRRSLEGLGRQQGKSQKY
jgi:hypothetical protein